MRIESPNWCAPAFRCERTILPDSGPNSALLNGLRIRPDVSFRGAPPPLPDGRWRSLPGPGRRARICPDSMRARVAQAGCSTATTRTRPSTCCGRRCEPSSGPTSSSQRVKTASITAGVGAEPSRPSTRGIESPTRRGPLSLRRVTFDVQALHGEHPGHLDPFGQGGGRGQDGLPGRQLGHQRPAPGRVELGEDVVEQEGRDEGRPVPDEPVHAQAQGQSEAALFALRRVGPGLPAVDLEEQVVTVGPDGVDSPAQVVPPGGVEGVEQVPSQLRTYRCTVRSRVPAARPGGCRPRPRRDRGPPPGVRGRPPAPFRRPPGVDPIRRGSP